MNPHDGIVLQTEVDDKCDKLQWSTIADIVNLTDLQRSSLSS